MLKKANRISDSNRIQEVLSKGTLHKSPFFNIRYLKSATSVPRFAVTISKKKVKKAAKRNFLKRRLMEAIRPGLDSAPNVDAVILPNTSGLTAMHQSLTEAFNNFFNLSAKNAK